MNRTIQLHRGPLAFSAHEAGAGIEAPSFESHVPRLARFVR